MTVTIFVYKSSDIDHSFVTTTYQKAAVIAVDLSLFATEATYSQQVVIASSCNAPTLAL